ncbi:Ferritin-3 chloroplastic [Dissostichus eleginoides]|uniref:Ferritin-3 chloroplastic n=1 Tax=Dissostichus eleginoides TaxID=100907 RepID=A0AAD9FLC9_DISEL|nr:Ferritin-3 chloroplastic [Dissostichus eleginoides]
MVTRSLPSSYMRLVRRRPAWDWCSVVAVAACVAPWGGRGRYKVLLPHTQSFTLEEENQHGGLVNLEPRDPPQPPYYLPTTGVYFPTLYRPGTRTCSEKNLHSTSTK